MSIKAHYLECFLSKAVYIRIWLCLFFNFYNTFFSGVPSCRGCFFIMIINGALSPERQRKSRINYNIFNVINGFSYMCLGETVIILLAIRLQCPDSIAMMLNAMIYLGFTLLPLGKIMTARVGAARSQMWFWIFRNGAALLVASAPLWLYMFNQYVALAVVLLGAFLFYGFRAAGVVMGQPLLGDITNDDNRAGFIARSNGLFFVSAIAALLIIIQLIEAMPSTWTLVGIIIFGASLGVFASTFLAKIDESDNIRRSARRPIVNEIRKIRQNPWFMSQVLAGFVCNFAIFLVVPAAMWLVKKGYGIDDGFALRFSLAQYGGSVVVGFIHGFFSRRWGADNVLKIYYIMLLLIGGYWAIAPENINYTGCFVAFFLAGLCSVGISSGMAHYFIQTVEPANRVAGSMVVSVVTSAVAGGLGMSLGAFIMWVLQNMELSQLKIYQVYFRIAFVLIAINVVFMLRLKKPPVKSV